MKDREQTAPVSPPDAPHDAPHDEDDARVMLNQLPKMSAPVDLTKTVPDLINRRSRGRFFGRRSLSDRLPLEWISLSMLVILALAYVLLKLLFVD